MIIRTPRPTSNFYILDKAISEDKRLTWAARGLLIFLLGKPDHWRVESSSLVNEVATSRSPTGKDGTYALLNELITAGYATRTAIKGDGGRIARWDFAVCETPHPANAELDSAIPHPAQPDQAQPDQANPLQVSIDGKQVLREPVSIEKKIKMAEKKPEQIGFDKTTNTFTNIDGQCAMDFALAYPAVNLDAEVRRAAIWITANPAGAPKNNYARFLASWLSRSQSKIDIAKATGQKMPVNFTDQRRDFIDRLTGRGREAANFTGVTFDA